MSTLTVELWTLYIYTYALSILHTVAAASSYNIDQRTTTDLRNYFKLCLTSAKHVFSANSLRAAQSASQQPKYPEQVQNFALSALGAGKYSPASTLALANILVLQMCPAKVIEGRLWVSASSIQSCVMTWCV